MEENGMRGGTQAATEAQKAQNALENARKRNQACFMKFSGLRSKCGYIIMTGRDTVDAVKNKAFDVMRRNGEVITHDPICCSWQNDAECQTRFGSVGGLI